MPYDDDGNIGSPGQFSWHIEVLLRFNYIKKVRFKKYKIIIPIELRKEIGIYYFLLRNKLNNTIVNLLIKYNPIKKSDIYKHLKGSRESIYYHINNLIEQNIIIKEGNPNYICINPDKKNIIIEVLNNINSKS
ncbi:MAG: hypothetical protein ACFFAN_06140 [Promethearchaeota archaeon]